MTEEMEEEVVTLREMHANIEKEMGGVAYVRLFKQLQYSPPPRGLDETCVSSSSFGFRKRFLFIFIWSPEEIFILSDDDLNALTLHFSCHRRLDYFASSSSLH